MKRRLVLAALITLVIGMCLKLTGCTPEEKCASQLTMPETCQEWRMPVLSPPPPPSWLR